MKVFHCPHCNHQLSSQDGKEVNLLGLLEAMDFSVVVPFVLSAELGNYESRVEGEVSLRDGARPDFQCPKCRQSLTAPWNADLAEIHLADEAADREDTVFFSRVYGTHATFVCDRAKSIILSYGADKDAYVDEFDKKTNFFGS
jgi:uncharacterized protein YbaR (Trm112 family)